MSDSPDSSWSSLDLFTRRDSSPKATPWLWHCLRRSSHAALIFRIPCDQGLHLFSYRLHQVQHLVELSGSPPPSLLDPACWSRDARRVSGTVLLFLKTTSSSSSFAKSSSSIASVSWKNLSKFVASASRCDFLRNLLAADLPSNTW